MLSSRQKRNNSYAEIIREAELLGEDQLCMVLADLCKKDLFYLLTKVIGRVDIDCDWLFDRCNEVQLEPDGYLDLWAREHYKSTIITFGKTIQDILIDPEITVGIFSHTKPIARAFLKQIKNEFEINEKLKYLFPDILYSEPKKEALSWSEEKGIIVKRKSNPKEATVEAYGLVDGQPTSKHYKLMVYDDVVTIESVTTPEMMEKVVNAWAISTNLGAEGGRVRYIGTRYHYNDAYKTILKRKSAVERRYPGTEDGRPNGKPVLWHQETMDKKRRDMGSFVFSCQILQDPKADNVIGFKSSDLRYYTRPPEYYMINFYILVDPANEKRKKSDYTAMWVIGLGTDRNYYVFEMVRDRLGLTERTNLLMQFHQEYLPVDVAYEQYGMQSDIAHIEYVQEQRNYRFNIVAVGGNQSKHDRICKLIPITESNRLWLPRHHYRTNYEGKREDLVEVFVKEELEAFPVLSHDDLLDGLARIKDPDLCATFPKPQQYQSPMNVSAGYGRY